MIVSDSVFVVNTGIRERQTKIEIYFPKFYWKGPLPNLCLHHFPNQTYALAHTSHTASLLLSQQYSQTWLLLQSTMRSVQSASGKCKECVFSCSLQKYYVTVIVLTRLWQAEGEVVPTSSHWQITFDKIWSRPYGYLLDPRSEQELQF